MCSRSCVVFWTLAWIALLNSLLVTTLGWSLNPAYERRRFLRREQAQFLQSGVQPLRPEGRPLFGRRIIRSVADPPSRDASAIEDWKRELQESIVRKTKRQESDVHVVVNFECAPGQAVCRNGGQGPAITYRWQHLPICTCLCPPNYTAPRCETDDGTVVMKRRRD